MEIRYSYRSDFVDVVNNRDNSGIIPISQKAVKATITERPKENLILFGGLVELQGNNDLEKARCSMLHA